MPEHISEDARLYYEALEASKSGRYDHAIDLLVESLAISEHYKTVELLAICHANCGSPKVALEYFERAYKLNEASSKTACLLAEQLLGLGDPQRARAIVEKILLRQNDYGPATRILARLTL